jgi:hypothetical protein
MFAGLGIGMFRYRLYDVGRLLNRTLVYGLLTVALAARYAAARTIEAFAVRLRRQVDPDALQAELLAVVDQTVQPTRASLRLQPVR